MAAGSAGLFRLMGREAREGARRARKSCRSDVRKRGPNLSLVYTEVKRKVPDVAGPFSDWRLVQLHDQQVFQARLQPGVDLRDPRVSRWLSRWPGRLYAQDGPDGVEVTLARRSHPRPRERWWLHLLLLAATLLTATLAGAALVDGDPLRFRNVSAWGTAIPVPTRLTPAALAPGTWFSLPLMLILGVHELGHYALARRHGMDVSPPYFLPSPPLLSLIGTFGAFIRLRSPLLNRAVLLDMGAAGPLAGFAVALPVTVLGLALSTPVDAALLPAEVTQRIGIVVDGGVLPIGQSLGFMLLRMLSPVGGAAFVDLHPLAFAGWLGMLFTAMNLVPIGQLDGGHVMYALSERTHRIAGRATLAMLLVMGTGWMGWLVWAALILLVGRGRIAHPPVFDPSFRLDRRRTAVAWLCIALFCLTFVPAPFPL
jgi:membrane-associated protease RseP (regulator of RpoE activity)